MRSGYQTLPYHADGAAFVQQSRSVRSLLDLSYSAGVSTPPFNSKQTCVCLHTPAERLDWIFESELRHIGGETWVATNKRCRKEMIKACSQKNF